MSFQNLPGQLLALFLGWVFTLYIQHLSNRRTEALKRKDMIINRLDELPDWVEGEVGKEKYKPELTEEAYTGLILQIELRVNQFNSHVGKNRPAIDTQKLAALRDIDFFDQESLEKLSYEVRSISSSLIEHIELKCDSIYFNNSWLCRINNFVYDLHGVTAGLLIIIFSLLLGKIITFVFF